MPVGISLHDEIENLMGRVLEYIPKDHVDRIRHAVDFAKMAHGDQIRKSGEPYIIHPLQVAQILTNYHADEDTLIAAVLHDVPEDTNFTLEDVEKEFGKKIAYLVEGITKLSKVYYRHDMAERQVESLKKLFIHSAEDIRVILIKLADRLHNMRTLQFISKDEKRIRIAKETLEVYVPIAKLLGINEIRTELEDLCFEHLYPEECAKMKQELEENAEERAFILDEMVHLAGRELEKNGIKVEFSGRMKTLFSTYQKLQLKKNLNQIDDLMAIRIIVPTRRDCYSVLGILHRLFKPKTGSFKDYIAVPKPNGYQSLHTTVFGINGSIVEFQVRTNYMHLEAEYGIASHYFYKYSNERELAAIMRKRSEWVSRILEIQKEEGRDFMENLKLDVFSDRIFVFTPKGDVMDLPKGASAIDLAYAIHTDIGNHAVKAEINGINYPLTSPLSTGDTVSIITNKNQSPSREWLAFAKTHIAQNRIRQELKKIPHETKLMIGKKFLQREFDRIGKNYIEELSEKRLALLGGKLPYRALQDVLVAVAEGSLNPRDIIGRLYEKNPMEGQSRLRMTGDGKKHETFFKVGLRVLGNNSKGQFREILRMLNGLKIPVLQYAVDTPRLIQKDRCVLTLLVRDYDELSQVFESLEGIEGVEGVKRTFFGRKLLFFLWGFLTLMLWVVHPLLIRTLEQASRFSFLIYLGVFSLVGLIGYLRVLTKKTFPQLEEFRGFWLALFLLTLLALATTIAEFLFFDIPLNWIFIFGVIVGIFTFLINEYSRYRHEIQ